MHRSTNESDYTPLAPIAPPSSALSRPARAWSIVLIAAGVAVFPLDGWISRWATTLGSNIGGDLHLELLAIQQFGQFTTTVLILAAIWLLDPPRRRRLLDPIAAMLVTAAVVIPMKILIGRPRPQFDDPGFILGPFGSYPISPEVGVRHAWEVGSGISSDLWSMPSSHAAYAVVLSVAIAHLYPRVRPLVVALAATVAACRVLFGEHYLGDVLFGAGLALATSAAAMRGYWGVRGLDWLWVRLVNRSATPAYPAAARLELARQQAADGPRPDAPDGPA